MNKSVSFGMRLAEGIQKHPRRARFIALSITIAIFGLIGASVWYELSRGRYVKLLIIGGIAIWGGVKAYRQAKQTART